MYLLNVIETVLVEKIYMNISIFSFYLNCLGSWGYCQGRRNPTGLNSALADFQDFWPGVKFTIQFE